MIENIFTADPTLDGDAVDALSAALLNAVKTAVEEDQSHGLQLLSNLDTALTDKVSYQYAPPGSNLTKFIRSAVMPNARFYTHRLS